MGQVPPPLDITLSTFRHNSNSASLESYGGKLEHVFNLRQPVFYIVFTKQIYTQAGYLNCLSALQNNIWIMLNPLFKSTLDTVTYFLQSFCLNFLKSQTIWPLLVTMKKQCVCPG